MVRGVLLSFALLAAARESWSWNVSLPLSFSGLLFVSEVSDVTGNLSWSTVVDSGSSDTVLLAAGAAYINASRQASGVDTAAQGKSHSLFVDDAVIMWPGAVGDSDRTLLAPLPLIARTSAASRGLINASVLLSPSISASGGAPKLAVDWVSSGSVLGVLGGTPQLAPRTPFTALTPYPAPGCNASAPCFAVMSLQQQCSFNLTGMLPSSPCVGLSPARTAAHFTLAGSLSEVLATARMPTTQWSLPPRTSASPTTALFASAVFDLALCGSKLLPTTHSVPAVFDSGAACLTLPSEAFDALVVQLGDKVQCPATQQQWPAGSLGADGRPQQCALADHTQLQQLPWLHWSASPADGRVSVPLASLVYQQGNDSSARRWLCVRRGAAVADAVAAATPQLARIVLGSMLLRSQTFLLDYSEKAFGIRGLAQDGAVAWESSVGSVGIVAEGGGLPGCQPRQVCPTNTVYDATTGSCRLFVDSCNTYAYFEANAQGVCTQRWGAVGALLGFAVLLALADTVMDAHRHALCHLAMTMKTPGSQSAVGFSSRLSLAMSQMRRDRRCLAWLLQQCDRPATQQLLKAALESDPTGAQGEARRVDGAEGRRKLTLPGHARRGAFACT